MKHRFTLPGTATTHGGTTTGAGGAVGTLPQSLWKVTCGHHVTSNSDAGYVPKST